MEWSVLESIHPAICVSNEDAIATLRIPVELGHDTPLRINDTLHADLDVLPPIHLRVALPPLYPSQSPPIIQSLHSAWLPPPTLLRIRECMTAMWSPGDDSGVLYTWVEWIRTGDFLADVGLLADDMHTIQIPHPSPQVLLSSLLAYLSSSKSDEFARTSYLCAICLLDRKGIHGLALSCGHVFCKACLVAMWGLHLKEGQVSLVGCPDPDCGESADGFREATEDEVRPVLSESELDRWKWLRKKRDLEHDPTMIHCPMEYCQEPVTRPQSDPSTIASSDDDESAWARLRICTACSYSFCAFCRRTWHGPHMPCPLPLTSKFILDYRSAPPGSSKRRAIEHRYGRGNVRRLVQQHKEEQANREWMDSNTMACPGCEVRVQKSIGCNHMTCAKCKTHFCYHCGIKMSGANPYQHFSTPNTPCFMKLFDFVPNAGNEWQPAEAFEFI